MTSSYDQLGQAEQQAIALTKVGIQRLLRAQFRHRATRVYTALVVGGFIDVLAAAERQPELVRVVNEHLAGTPWHVVARTTQ